MTKRELLEERYEDALFSLLMDAVLISEGHKALEENEQLRNDPEAQVPEALDRRCEQRIRRCFTKLTARAVGRCGLKALKYVAMAAGLAAILFTGAFGMSETVRVNTMNMVNDLYGESMLIYFGDELSRQREEMELEVRWIPEGYVLVDQGRNFASIWYNYEKSENEYLRIRYSKTDGMRMRVDTEDAQVSEVEINGIMGTWIKAEEVQQLILIPDGQETMVLLIGGGLSEKDFVRVAANLKFN